MFKFNVFKKVIACVCLILSAGCSYAYKLILINDSRDANIKFFYEGKLSGFLATGWEGGKTENLRPYGVSALIVGRTDSIGYQRKDKGTVEIIRQFGDWKLDNLDGKDFVIIRFNRESGYTVIIYKKDKDKLVGKEFVCEHKKLGGKILYDTTVTQTEIMPEKVSASTLDNIYENFKKLRRQDSVDIAIGLKDIGAIHDKIKAVNAIELNNLVIGGEIDFGELRIKLEQAKEEAIALERELTKIEKGVKKEEKKS